MGIEGAAQVKNDAFADGRIELPLPDAYQAAHDRDGDEAEGQQVQLLGIPVGNGVVDEPPQQQGGYQADGSGEQDGEQQQEGLGGVRPRKHPDALQQSAGDNGSILVLVVAQVRPPTGAMKSHK